MHKSITTLATIAILFLVTACAGFQRPLPAANYGSPPQGYEEAIKAQFESSLKDPGSAQYKFGRPVKAYANEGLAFGGKVNWIGYLVDVQVNAKNSFGGYVGYKPYMVLFSGNNVVQLYQGTEHILVHRME